MTTILEISKAGEVAISLLDDGGIVTHSVPLFSLTGDEMSSLYHARSHAEEAGWQTYGDWNEGEEFSFIPVVPKPLTLTFVGGELPEAEAIRYAKNAGFDVGGVVKQVSEPELGKTFISFSMELPNGWEWGDGPF